MSLSRTLRALARLLSYPDDELRSHLPALREVLRAGAAVPRARLQELVALTERLEAARPLVAEGDYVDCFDRGRATSLHLFEHVHGDSRDRGQAMIDLVQTYEAAGLHLGDGELPDHLTVALEFASTQPDPQARAFLREFAHILRAIFSALRRRESAYASVLAALLEIAGERVEPVPVPEEPPLDETWDEPPAFAGCSTAGQRAPGGEQPIHFTRRREGATGARP